MLMVLSDELEILRSMQPLDNSVFHYLAERVDFETGLIGQARKVSYGGMAYDLSEHDTERRRRESIRTVTSKQVENSINRLVNAGLLSRQSKSGFNQSLLMVRVFWADLLGKGYCDQKADGSADGSQLGVLLSVLSKFNISNFNKLQETEQKEKTIEPCADGKAVGTTSITQHTTYRDGEFSMTMDWQPTVDEFEAMLLRCGFSLKQVDSVWVTEFVGFWSLDKNRGRRYSQRDWTHKLAMAMLDYLRNPGLYERRRGNAKPAGKTAGSVAQGRPEWAMMPREDEYLQGWASRHGYPAADVGWSYQQYRNVLRTKVEIRLAKWRRLS
jgi:hypothetical protein